LTTLKDYSALKRTENVEIPLNGEVYYAHGDPPANVPLGSLGALEPEDLEAMAAAAQAVADGNGEMPADPALLAAVAKASGAGMTQTRRALQMLQQVLLPESLQRWELYMRSADPQWTDEQKAHHAARHITLAQVMAVHQDLVAYYGQRPTTPSQSSPNGLGGTGGTSTAGVQLGG
jgi:hypothetical protein